MTNHWSGVIALALALSAYGCGETANGGNLGGSGGDGGSGGTAGDGGDGGMGGDGGIGGDGGMGGMGGVGGMPDLCADAATRCDDSNECTENQCNDADGVCSNPNETNGTSCDLSGVPGICTDGVCEDAMRCADAATRCDDENPCTQDLCEPADGACSNPDEPDETACEFAAGVGGECISGVCTDAMLCADAETRCDDENPCTADDCDTADGSCSNDAVPDMTVCEFAPGVGGVCTAGACVDAMLCADAETRCDDENACTQNLCEPADGVCSNPDEPDETACEFAAGVGGECISGVCTDAMLCADADPRCDDMNECTDNLCDTADGVCSNPAVADETACEFAAGVGGECISGVCTDAMLCADADPRCDDSNECTNDDCDPADGMCSNTNLPGGTDCDAAGLPGECDGAGACVAVCAPAPGQNVVLPTSGTPTATYTDVPNGFTITAANCGTQPKCEVTFSSPRGVGANTFGDALQVNPGDSLLIEFFDLNGNARDASDVSILLFTNGVAGSVEVVVDSAAAITLPANPGQALDLSGITGHSFQITLTNTVPGAFHFWSELSYDHACL